MGEGNPKAFGNAGERPDAGLSRRTLEAADGFDRELRSLRELLLRHAPLLTDGSHAAPELGSDVFSHGAVCGAGSQKRRTRQESSLGQYGKSGIRHDRPQRKVVKKISKPRPVLSPRSQELAKIRREDVVFVDLLELDYLQEQDLEVYVALQALRGELKALMAAGRQRANNRMTAIRLRQLTNWANEALRDSEQTLIRGPLALDDEQHVLEHDARCLQSGWLDAMYDVAFHLADTKGSLSEESWKLLQRTHELCTIYEGSRLKLERARADGWGQFPSDVLRTVLDEQSVEAATKLRVSGLFTE